MSIIMKKVVLLITVLFISVISTACINNLAVQELNNKAKSYIENGETDKAICRLRSSIDLDASIFETHYNLGVALLSENKYEEARDAFVSALKLNPDFADAYYSLGIVYEGLAGEVFVSDDNENENDKDDATSTSEDKVLSEVDKTKLVENYSLAIDNYNKFLAKVPDSEEKDKIESRINDINKEILKFNPDRNTQLSPVAESSSSVE